MQYPIMESYLVANDMRGRGFGSQFELYALAHMLQRCVYTYTLLGTPHSRCHCPSKVDSAIPPPLAEHGVYLDHTGNHYKVVTSLAE